jgi:hypothetical protein
MKILGEVSWKNVDMMWWIRWLGVHFQAMGDVSNYITNSKKLDVNT